MRPKDTVKPGDIGKQTARDAPEKTSHGETVSKVDVGTTVAGELVGFGIVGAVLEFAPAFFAMAGWLASMQDTINIRARIAFQDGVRRGSGNCWSAMVRGKSRFTYDEIWLFVESMTRYSKYLPAHQHEVEPALSKGVDLAVKIWNDVMEETEHQTRLAIYDVLHRQKRPIDEADRLYEVTVQDVRKEVAKELDQAINDAVGKL